ncbi:MAG: DUF503 domain-containing protein [Spirochaetales bacterium]|jgi:uncharacterized protein YlxP (DUF503 family)|nr:DUF503 domain-containing protein [Spirochaetales bacterium]
MIVSMIQMIIELPDIDSIKDKRRLVHSLRDKLRRRFQVSAAEVDLQDALLFTQIGCALVSNSRTHGEEVMQKILRFAENESPGRIQDVQITSEQF